MERVGTVERRASEVGAELLALSHQQIDGRVAASVACISSENAGFGE
jgi:hypothetical protein